MESPEYSVAWHSYTQYMPWHVIVIHWQAVQVQ